MNFGHRSYSGKLFRPKPEIYFEPNGNLLIIASPWGSRTAAEKAVDLIKGLVLAAHEDREITSPFEKLSCLSPLGNNIRTAIKLTNDKIYSEENRTEYKVGLELFVGALDSREFIWAQVGQPHLFILRNGGALAALACPIDLSFSIKNQSGIPLPGELLGLDATSNFSVRSVQVEPGDQLIFLARSTVPDGLTRRPQAPYTLESLTRSMALEEPETPFWLGILGI